MKIIIGVDHLDKFIPEVLTEVEKQSKKLKKKRLRIGIESTEKTIKEQSFWLKLSLNLKGKSDIVFLDSITGAKVADRAMKTLQTLGTELSPQTLERCMKELYVGTELRDKSMINKIRKQKPDIIIVGGIHAYSIGKKLKIKPVYVGSNAKKTREIVMILREFYAPFKRIRNREKWKRFHKRTEKENLRLMEYNAKKNKRKL